MGTILSLRRSTALAAVLVFVSVGAASGSGARSVGDAQSPATSQVRAPSSELVVDRTIPLGNARVHRVKQRVSGIEVLGSLAIVSETKGASRVLSDTTKAGLSRPSDASIGRGRAIEIAMKHAGVRVLREGEATAQLAILPVGAGKLVWKVEIAAGEPLADLEVLIDAATREVLRLTDLLRYETGAAALFDPNPPVSNGGSAGLEDRKDKDSDLLTALRTPVALPRIDPGQTCLIGAFVEVRVRKQKKRVCDGALDWTDVTRSSNDFEALMAYFHIDRTQEYIQSIGFTNVNNRQQLVLADSFKAQNAFYSPFKKRIQFGTGRIDSAEDADVIVHEYGHAIQDNQVPGYGRSFDAGAMGEGFSDYLASALSAERSPTTSIENQLCMSEWFGLAIKGSVGCLRRLDDPRALTEAFGNARCALSIHCIGQVWSSALFSLRTALGDDVSARSVMDRVILAAHFLMPPDVSFAQAAAAVECADDSLYPAGAIGDCQGEHFAQIHAEFVSRAFL